MHYALKLSKSFINFNSTHWRHHSTFLKTDFPIHLNYRRVESSNGKAKKWHDHVTKNIVTLFILNSRRPTVQMRPNLYLIRRIR